ncbi:hypothetical protein Tco_0573444 [Tanacetum coccineum]
MAPSFVTLELRYHQAACKRSPGPETQFFTSVHISSGLVPNSAPSTASNAPCKKDFDILFKPMFDEYFKPSTSDIYLIISAAALPQDTV